VWNIAVKAGDLVESGQRMVIIESMKTEIAVTAPQRGTVAEILCAPSAQVAAGQSLLLLRTEVC
jgi:urea carboxylase